MKFVKHRKIFFAVAGILGLASLCCLLIFGLKPGIDFTGGSILEVEYKLSRPPLAVVLVQLQGLALGEISLQTVDDKGLLLRMKELDETGHQKIIQALNEEKTGDDVLLLEKRFESIGAVVGQELKDKTKTLIIWSLLLIVLYIAIAFRKVQRPCKSWQYGFVSLITLFYDILIPLGVFAVLGRFYNVEVSIPVIIALLTVLGYTINDKVVVFDRTRENLLRGLSDSFEETINSSINQTLTRSINTSFTTLICLFSLYLFGGETLRYFSLALMLGVVVGTCSSIFLAGPMLVSWVRFKEKRQAKKRRR